MNETPEMPAADQFRRKRASRRHQCETCLPDVIPTGVERGDQWMCPECRRRWLVTSVGSSLGLHAEGVDIKGADGSVYWRAFRARFIGAVGLNA